MKGFFGILAIATTSLVLSACTIAHVNNFKFDASPSPEVSGPEKDLDGESMARVSASFTAADEDEVTFPVSSHVLDASRFGSNGGSLERVNPDSVRRVYSNNAVLKIDGYNVSASLDFFVNLNLFYFQLGIGVYDGLYYYAGFGANRKYYEWGVFIGEFNQFTTIDYFGYWCGIDGCTEEDMDDSYVANDFLVLGDVFFGAYVGAHVWRLSLNNTVSMYVPGVDVGQMEYEMPVVVSNYTSLGFRIIDNWSVRGGTVITFVRDWSEPHLGFKFSLNYDIGAESSIKKKNRAPAETGALPPAETQPVKVAEEQPAAPETEPVASPETEPAAEKETPAEPETAAEADPAPEPETPAESAETSADVPAEAQAEESAE